MKLIWQKLIYRPILNLRLIQKLMLSYFLLIILPLCILSYVFYFQVAAYIEQRVKYSSQQIFEQADAFLTYKLKKISDVSEVTALDPRINDILSRSMDSYTLQMQLRDAEQLHLILTSFQREEDADQLILYVGNPTIYTQERVNLYGMQDAYHSTWYKRLTLNKPAILWYPQTDKSNLSAIRLIHGFNSYSTNVGVLQVNFKRQLIEDIVAKTNTTQQGVAYIQNSFGEIIASSNQEQLKQWQVDEKTVNSLLTSPQTWKEITWNDERIMIGTKLIDGTDWKLISIVPYQEILKSSRSIRNQILLTMLITGTLAYLLAYYISSIMTRRISLLIRKMNRVKEGDLETIKTDLGKDEIGQLVENYSYMIENTKKLLEDQFALGIEIKSAELKALQSQINPHFLYNTLDLINWIAIERNVPEISSLIVKMSRLYKLTLGSGKEIVSIEDELTHAALYVDIQNSRFDSGIKFEVRVEDDCYRQLSIPKITLQPIVENAILHGIMEKPDRNGFIQIDIRKSNKDIVISIEDNGVGMTEEQIFHAVRPPGQSKSQGYGLSNIHHRFQLFYGAAYGLSFTSALGIGTKVEIRLPYIEQ